MAWNRRDDGANEHPKILALGAWQPDLLWQKAGVGCSKSATGGIIAPHDLELYGFHAYLRTPAALRKATRKLVEVGLWHDHETVHDCTRCLAALTEMDEELAEGSYMFHDWFDCNPGRRSQEDSVAKFKENRARQLRGMVSLRDYVVRRDKARCRYCGVTTTVTRGDTRSPKRRVLDHVDHMGPNTTANLVVACGRCNGRKKDKTLEEAGMTLLPVPADSTVDADDPAGTAPPPQLLQVEEESAETMDSPPENRRKTVGFQSKTGGEPTTKPAEIPRTPAPALARRAGHGRSGGKPADLRRGRDGQVWDGSGPGTGGAGPGQLGLGRSGPSLAGLFRAGTGTGGDGPGGHGAEAPAPPLDQRSPTTSTGEEFQP